MDLLPIAVAIAFACGVVFGLALDRWILPFLVDERNALMRRGR